MVSTPFWFLMSLVGSTSPVPIQGRFEGFVAAALAQDKQDKKDEEKKQEDGKKEADVDAVWAALDDGSPDKFKAATAGADTAKLVEAIRKGRAVKEATPGEVKEKLKDAFGAETDLILVFPSKIDKAKPLGVLLVLHGLGANGAQARDWFGTWASVNNYILAAPSAQKEPDSAKNEDSSSGPAGAKEPAQWWSYRDGGFPLAALSVLKKRHAIDENRVILAGYSMGGFATWNIGLRFPDRFSALVSFAGGLSRAEYIGLRVDERLRRLHLNSFNLPIYFVHGEADKNVPVEFDRESRNQLKKLGYEFEYKELPKVAHNLNLKEGGEIMGGVERWLKDKVRKPHPKEVKFFALGDYCAQSYWVRVAEFKDKSAEVRASIKVQGKDQVIEVTATGAKQVAFYIDETLLDLSKPIKVKSGKEILFDKEIKPSADVVLESWKSREDRELLYRAKVVVEFK